jgi:rhodanese-related sulfurtransferase
MAPLVPDIISNEFNYVVALLIGIAFGFILEQAGFSSSKKLVGLFYGYDFTVLRVFFTAGVTAMLGIIAFVHFGMLDINLIYINPTFIWSALAGGFIMGLGFVIGGYCPGTSFCGASIGKIDAMIFIGGLFIGVFAFAEGYPLWEQFYKSGNWGYPRMFETLGMSQSLFAFMLTAVAIMAFIFTTYIERRVNGTLNTEFKKKKLYYSLAATAFVIGLSAFIMPDRQMSIISNSNDAGILENYKPKSVSVDELALMLINGDNRFQIIDFRIPEKYREFRLPKSINLTYDNLFGKDADKLLSVKNMRNIFVDDNETNEKKAAYIASELGYDVYILTGGLNSFKETILNFKKPAAINTLQEADTYRFREKASKIIPGIIDENMKKGTDDKKKTKRVLGGC